MAESPDANALREVLREEQHETHLTFVDRDVNEIASRSGNGIPVPEVGDVVDFAEGNLFEPETIEETDGPYEVLERQISYGELDIEVEVDDETIKENTTRTYVFLYVEETTLSESFENVDIR